MRCEHSTPTEHPPKTTDANPPPPFSPRSLGPDAAGYIYIGMKGYFILQLGSLTLQLDYWQAMNVPSCDLTSYAQVQPDGGVCSNPPSNGITDS